VFPIERPRRLRRTSALRRLVAETSLAPADLVAPLFVAEGRDEPRAITSLPGHFQHTLESLSGEVRALKSAGVRGVILFGVPQTKDELGSGAFDDEGIVQVALRRLRDEFGDAIVVMADLCLDEYTSHGHCGVLRADGTVDNDATLDLYARSAVAQAKAGAAVVAPSGMMDGQVGAIREALDAEGYVDTVIMAYSAKYASALYGPFRDAVGVEIANGGDRRSYQQDYRNRRESWREARLDVDEGADIVMVKPAMTYLDVLSDLRREVDVPLCAYHVSGEYSMIKAAAANGWIDGEAVALEQLTAVRRAGADFVLTYFAREVAEALNS
jgi:porphobilinogen synthase